MKHLLTIGFILSFIFVLSMTSSCASDISKSVNPGDSTTSPVVSPKNSPNQVSTDLTSVTPNSTEENAAQSLENDILLSISTNKVTYVPGEIILVTASVENRSDNFINYVLSSIGNPTPYVYLETNSYFSGFSLEEKEMGGVRTVLPMVTSGQLKPHQILKREVIWDQMIFLKNQQAPAGNYGIRCGLTIGDYQDQSSQKSLSVSTAINIVGASEWITQDQAKNIALNLLEVKSWQETHSGTSLVKQENGNYFVFMQGEWQKVTSQFSVNEQKTPLTLENYKEWTPDVSVILDQGSWIITLGTKLGPSPHFVRIQIDPVTGNVVDSQFSR